ncbi:MAG: Ig-like domain-containing protein [Chloroflexi bacterium]|nr:Ig-like domain-containing protein [Chloroflexota bacterium]
MSIRSGRWLLVALLSLLLLLATVTPVLAADPVTLELLAPQQVALGDKVEVTAVLRDGNGVPIRGGTVNLWTPATFLSTGGAIDLGRATTDAQGRATFRYEARTEGPVALNAYFPGDSRYAYAQGSAELKAQGTAQLYQSTAGVRVPGIGVWLLVGLLGGVWTTYLAVMVFLSLIAREGSRAPVEAGGHRG